MARRKKANGNRAQPRPGGGPVDVETLRYHAQRIGEAKGEADGARSEANARWTDAEAAGIHKAALKAAMKIRDLEIHRAQAFWRALESYMHILGVFDQLDMFDQVSDEDAGEEGVQARAAHAAGDSGVDPEKTERRGRRKRKDELPVAAADPVA